MALPGNKDFNEYDNYVTDPNPTTSAQAQDYFRNQAELLKAVIDCEFWQPETVYQPGDVVKSDSMPNGTEAVMVATKASVTSNVEPQWGAVGSANISDGACFWKLRWQHWSKSVEEIADLTTGATNRLPNKAYTVGNVVYTDNNLSVALKCTTAGTTSNTELDVSGNNVGDSVTDGSVVWSVIGRDYTQDYEAIAQRTSVVEQTLPKKANLGALSMPSDKFININYNTFTPNSSSWSDLLYTVPADGWVVVVANTGTLSNARSVVQVINQNNNVGVSELAYGIDWSVRRVSAPFSKGQIAEIGVVNMSSIIECKFVYAQSEV